jgi:hypothetical protein
MGESIAKYQDLAGEFTRLGGPKLSNLSHGGDVVTASFRGSPSRMDAQKLAAWMKKTNVGFIGVGGVDDVTLHWFL